MAARIIVNMSRVVFILCLSLGPSRTAAFGSSLRDANQRLGLAQSKTLQSSGQLAARDFVQHRAIGRNELNVQGHLTYRMS